MNKTASVILALVIFAGSGAAAQHTMPPGMSHEDHLRQMHKDEELKHRGALAMGFDQDASVHHFLLRATGGAIVVSSRNPKDTALIAQIRAHFVDIADAFSKGLFDKAVETHAGLPPGAAVMAERKQHLRYRYVEQSAGAIVVIETHDRPALDALHDFLRYQIVEHNTGDPLTVQ